MANLTVIEEIPITLAELKTKVDSIQLGGEELSFRTNKVKEYLMQFTRLNLKEVTELKKKLQDLDIPRMKEKQIVKIIDLLPRDMDELRMVFAGENTTINQENMQKILDVVKDYVK
jgi:DNA-directed RNA polymerase subunit F